MHGTIHDPFVGVPFRRPKFNPFDAQVEIDFEEVPLFVTDGGFRAGLVDGTCTVTYDEEYGDWEITDISLCVERPGERERNRVPVSINADPAFWVRLSDAITAHCGAQIDGEIEERCS